MEKNRVASGGIDMLSGGLYKNIFLFALPLIASGMLQQSFNSVDMAVVGRFADSMALAAVGSNGPVIGLIVNLFVGISLGANVVIANYIGRGNESGIKKAVSTAGALALISGLLMMTVGLTVAEPILALLGTPDDVIDEAAGYLKIVSLGFPFMMIYNFSSAIMRSRGDTRNPFYALVAGGIVNVILNLALVIVFRMGVAGVALGTVAANIVSSVILAWILYRADEPFRLNYLKVWATRSEVAKILQIGLPAGIQGVVFSISNVFIQSAINSFGSQAVAGSAAAINYEFYSYFIISAFVQAVVAFTGQNFGAGNYERCRRVFRVGMVYAVAMSLTLNAVVALNKGFFISIFTSAPEVVEYAATRITVVLIFQFVACSYEIAGASLRGIGYSMTPAVLTIFGTCVLRLLWVWASANHFADFGLLMIIYPVTWTVTGLAVLIAFFRISRRVLPVKVKK
ncbi:MAG: MATE family efflux transporter [Muribaculaceae bacterium]